MKYKCDGTQNVLIKFKVCNVNSKNPSKVIYKLTAILKQLKIHTTLKEMKHKILINKKYVFSILKKTIKKITENNFHLIIFQFASIDNSVTFHTII